MDDTQRPAEELIERISENRDFDPSGFMPDIASQLSDLLAPVLMASLVLTAVLFILYVSSYLRRRKVDRAILDIQKVLREMNEREKARLSSPPTPPPSRITDRDNKIATESSEANAQEQLDTKDR